MINWISILLINNTQLVVYYIFKKYHLPVRFTFLYWTVSWPGPIISILYTNWIYLVNEEHFQIYEECSRRLSGLYTCSQPQENVWNIHGRVGVWVEHAGGRIWCINSVFPCRHLWLQLLHLWNLFFVRMVFSSFWSVAPSTNTRSLPWDLFLIYM